MPRSSLPQSILVVLLLSLAYWSYLALTTHMIITFDSIDYESLGRMLYNNDWASYFKTGPNREPLYPLLIAVSMHMEHLTGLAYTKIMAFFGILLLCATQILIYIILKKLHVRTAVCAVTLAYFAISPAMNNAAFSLYSEIAVLPVILGILLASAGAWDAIAQNKRQKALIYGALLGVLLTTATFLKAIFECIAPIYLIIFFAAVFLTDKKRSTPFILCVAATFYFFYLPITDYKCLNRIYNGNFVITNRGSWALYGNTARRMEPLTVKRFAEALAYAPGEGVCNSIFGPEECDFWSFRKSDELGFAKVGKSNNALLKASAKKALQNPFQYTLLAAIEGTKMFFWESTQIGFVSYPYWLEKVYTFKIFNNGLRFLVFLLTLIAVVSVWLGVLTAQRSPIRFLVGLLIFLYIFFFSFFFILTRYALPIAPLYLICISLWLEQILAPKKRNAL